MALAPGTEAGVVPLHMHVLNALSEAVGGQTRDTLIPNLISGRVAQQYDVTPQTVDGAIKILLKEKLVKKIGDNKGLAVVEISDHGKSQLGPMRETSQPWEDVDSPEAPDTGIIQ